MRVGRWLPPVVLTCILAGAALGAELANVAGSAYGTKAVADTCYEEKHGGHKAIDGSLEPGEGCWYSRDRSELPCALTLELSQVEEVQRVVLHQANWNGSMYHSKDMSIEVSADGQTWRQVATAQLPDENNSKTEVELGGVRTKWLRVVVLTSYIDFQTCGLAEVEMLVAGHPGFGQAEVLLDGEAAPEVSSSHCGLQFLAGEGGPQVAVVGRQGMALVAVGEGESVDIAIPLQTTVEAARVTATATLVEGAEAQVGLGLGEGAMRELTSGGLELQGEGAGDRFELSVKATGPGEALVRVEDVRLEVGGREFAVPIAVGALDYGNGPPPRLPAPSPTMARALIEWDWRLQDGIGTARELRTYAEAIGLTLERGERLIEELEEAGVGVGDRQERWEALKGRVTAAATEAEWEQLWREVHWLRREVALSNPLADVGPLLFVKHVPAAFSHQLTQHYGRYARPGGGVFLLDKPGELMQVSELTEGLLPEGSYRHPEVSYEGDRALFAFAEAETTPENTVEGHKGRYYHLYELELPRGERQTGETPVLQQLMDGPYDDFSPRYLPDGKILFISTRRGGWHRCGYPGCETYVVTVADADGSNPTPLSYHETQEWDPAVLNDGRIAYTRWDYVDRLAVLYQQLWSMFPDGSQPSILFGNATYSPIGTWEPRAVPGSKRIMATAAAHHAMTAGSIILVDVAGGVDGMQPLTRLTPDAPFPESETTVPGSWHLVGPGVEAYDTVEQRRWPGHCYRSPWPLSEDFFLAAYSYDGLVGEPTGNRPNMFGLYLVDAFGNKELLYRDLNISSVWPTPIRPRPRPPSLPSALKQVAGADEGLVLIQDVNQADPAFDDAVKALRIVQVLPKSTPGIDRPAVGLPRGAPGKQVLGTVPVETDGSAYFRVPARVPLSFQALDENGQAVQVMRSLTYLQPGETITCVGCHEPRTEAPPRREIAALKRGASVIEPAPEGSLPLSYPRLVQPVLDRQCVSCHNAERKDGDVALTGEPEGHYTVSYNALATRVPYSDQGMLQPISRPNQFGARGSAVTKLLQDDHYGVELTEDDWERLVTWMDANALFYGTFDPADQERQRRGELIAGPKLQ